MKTIPFFFVCLFITNCNSPMNHRSEEAAEKTQKASAFKLTSWDLSVKTMWLVGPKGSINFNNSLLVTISNSHGELEDLPVGLFLQFFAIMPSMGHPMDDAGTFERISKGIYLNSSIRYNMPGDWKNEIWVLDATYKTIEAIQWNDFF